MAKGFKGEVKIKVEGETYTLRMDLNAMASFEDQTGMAALDWAEKVEEHKALVRDMIKMVSCCLERHHEDAGKFLAGDILSEDPGILERLFTAAAPKPDEIEGQPGK
ncbi:GTA-gp10 family protein [Chachezhania antarctica]|uniref:GTA-gp10 family protein n=1 Tax=Chachezhania antarctica TaxID=2340860 RepID=UPI000EAFCBC1|nr:GTA-gp10 family protein [Chachezhania antarctica]